MHTLTESRITIDQSAAIVYLKQDDDVILVDAADWKEIRDVFARLAKEYERVVGR